MKPMFRVGDKVRLKKGLVEGHYADENGNKDCMLWESMIEEVKDKVWTIEEVYNYRYKLKEIDCSWWTCEMLELVEERGIQSEDLKDGMEVFIGNDDYRRIIINNGNEYVLFSNNGWYNRYSTDMLFTNQKLNTDVKKITYMGEVVYEKEKEYITLKEAVASGKPFKHKEADIYYYLLSNVIKEAEDVVGDEEIVEELYKKVWEIKED